MTLHRTAASRQVLPRLNAIQHAARYSVQDRSFAAKYPGEIGAAIKGLVEEIMGRLEQANRDSPRVDRPALQPAPVLVPGSAGAEGAAGASHGPQPAQPAPGAPAGPTQRSQNQAGHGLRPPTHPMMGAGAASSPAHRQARPSPTPAAALATTPGTNGSPAAPPPSGVRPAHPTHVNTPLPSSSPTDGALASASPMSTPPGPMPVVK